MDQFFTSAFFLRREDIDRKPVEHSNRDSIFDQRRSGRSNLVLGIRLRERTDVGQPELFNRARAKRSHPNSDRKPSPWLRPPWPVLAAQQIANLSENALTLGLFLALASFGSATRREAKIRFPENRGGDFILSEPVKIRTGGRTIVFRRPQT